MKRTLTDVLYSAHALLGYALAFPEARLLPEQTRKALAQAEKDLWLAYIQAKADGPKGLTGPSDEFHKEDK